MKIVRDSAFWIGVGSSFHQPGTVNKKVLESDFVPLCEGTTRCHSTWLNDTIPDSVLHLPNFQLIRSDRETESTGKSRGGGQDVLLHQ